MADTSFEIPKLFWLTAYALALASCSPSAPTGQALAVIGNDKITLRSVQFEMQGGQIDPFGTVERNVMNQGLERAVKRRILASEARDMGLEKDAQFHFAMRQTKELLLVAALERKLAKTVARPTAAAVDDFIAKQPLRFGQRYRLLLRRGNEDLEFDSFQLTPTTADIFTRAKTGGRIFMNGAVWDVINRVEDPISKADAERLAKAEIIAASVQGKLADIVAQNTAAGMVRYQAGWGPGQR